MARSLGVATRRCDLVQPAAHDGIASTSTSSARCAFRRHRTARARASISSWSLSLRRFGRALAAVRARAHDSRRAGALAVCRGAGERGWCSPASLAMIHAYHGLVRLGRRDRARRLRPRLQRHRKLERSTPPTAAGSVFARSSRTCSNLDHAARLIERNLPLAISYSWAPRRASRRAPRALRRPSRRAPRIHARRRLRDERSRRAERARRLSASRNRTIWQRGERRRLRRRAGRHRLRRRARFAVSSLDRIEAAVVRCRRCPRLRAYAAAIAAEKKRAHRDCTYWGRPVPGFGDPHARLLLVGLAPGAHGSNRTGRPFTGDASGDFLYPALHRAKFASSPVASSRDDGLRLVDCFITAAARCAPPQNKPTPGELRNCFPFLLEEFDALEDLRVAVGLGAVGFAALVRVLEARGFGFGDVKPVFAHGAQFAAACDGREVVAIASYHPSRQNTNTGKLTVPMFDAIFSRANEILMRDAGPDRPEAGRARRSARPSSRRGRPGSSERR